MRALRILLPVVLAGVVAVPAGGLPDAAAQLPSLCGIVPVGVQCGAGNGRRTAGGGEKVSHAGWPAVSGILWKVLDSGGRTKAGGTANDELLGHHGSDVLRGGAGDDILWGDWDPKGNTTRQRDVLDGGAGNDWIYPSHGSTRVRAGSGDDHVWAFYGHGTIDCGPGRDVARVRLSGAFRLRRCEVVRHFCAYGSDGHGGCRQPGAAASARSRPRATPRSAPRASSAVR
jgi:hypothetical protein